MNFIVRKGPFLKNNNNISKILINTLISLIPILIYYFIINDMNYIFKFCITLTSIVIANMSYEFIYNKKMINFKLLTSSLITSIIVCLLIPKNANLILLFFTSFGAIIINKFFKNINPILLILIFCYMFFISDIDNNIVFINAYIPMFLLIISYIYLLIKRAIKFRISGICIIFSIIGYFLKLYDINMLILLSIIDVYVISELLSTPNLAISQIIYAIVIGIISIIIDYNYLFMVILVFNILNIYIDLSFAFILANKKKC